MLVLVSLISLGGCQGEASEQRPSDRERQPPRPRAQLAPVPPLPVPGDPIYPEYYATLPLEDTRMHLAGAIHELLRARTRLVALDEEKYAAWIANIDGDIRVLVKLMCATRIELADVDIEHARIEDMFPLRYVETARAFVCVGFKLERRTVENDLWLPTEIRRQRTEAARDAGVDDDARP
ncbi:MAG: hypothetical protein IPL61_04920 [Myxococcales bacterium]|nr:hypothetical protein [Myxococcales bacterium]